MRKRLETFIHHLEQIDTLEALNDAVVNLRDLYEVDHLVYHSVNSTGEQYAALTYDEKWVNHYIDEDLSRVDPVVTGCYQRFHPVEWKQLDWSGKSARAFLGEAVSAGIGNQGVSVPIRGPSGQFALFTINHKANDDQWERYAAEHIPDLILLSHFINQKALEIENGTDLAPARALSPREKDALTLLALGYNRAQAAENLSISEHTLRVYIEAARHKLGASNTTHAVAQAMTRGLLLI